MTPRRAFAVDFARDRGRSQRPTRRALSWALLAAATALLGQTACRREEDPTYPPPPWGQPSPGQWQPSQAPAAPRPATAPVAAAGPAMGLPCMGDFDLQCPFARCVGGRCGGCREALDCKPSAVCGWTPFGTACVPPFAAMAAPGGPPTTPGPTMTPAPTWTPAPTPGPTMTPGPTTTPGPTLTPGGSGPFEEARRVCLAHTNALRARVQAAPLTRRVDREACADQAAQSDAQTGRIHGAFGQCGERAQNECPGWPGAPEAMVQGCLDDMFAEGPGEPYSAHGHYINMTATKYTGVTCGFHVAASGKVWMVQNFY